ncbi:MAG: SH3 domain-containing protein [Clostridia bacterium]|nr:SH3 domain-containing protein [Clostridia bacterium]
MILKTSGKGITKALITAILVMVMVVSVLVTVFAAEPTRRGKVTTSTGYTLNVRSEPVNGSVIGRLNSGDIVTVLGEQDVAGSVKWYLVNTGTVTGYVTSAYLEILPEETTPPSETTPPDETTGGDTPTETPPTVDFEAYLTEQGFPESYKPYLRELHALYPNWVFKAQHVEWDFEYAVDKEHGVALVENNNPSSWKSIEGDSYDWASNTWKIFDGDRWVRASRDLIRHYMDPRNFLGANSVFQFLEQSYDASVQNIEGVRRILAGTFMENDVTDTDGSLLNYATAIYNAGVDYKINPYVLSSMIIIEVGSQGSTIISGTYAGYEGYFNYFNIGAYSANGMGAVERGLWYAKGGNDGAGTSYGRPWNTRLKAIRGGAQFYADGYLTRGQNTLYLKRYNVQGANPFTHRYMTSVYGAAVEATKLAKGYTEELRTTPLSFYIPVYKNMADTAYPKPTLDGSPNMKLSSLSVSGFELTPNFDTEVLEYMLVVPPATSSITINAVPMDSTASIVGAGNQPLITGTNVFEIKVTAGNGTVRVYKLTVAKENPDNFGELTFTDRYLPKDNIVYGIAPGKTVGAFRTEFVSAGLVTVTNAAGIQKTDNDLIATDDIITVCSTNGVKYADYRASVKGDLNSDGKVNISDLLKIRNRILGSDEFSAVQVYSGDIDGNGSINISDLLKIRNHILGTNVIS